MVSLSTNTTDVSACASMDFPQPSLARPRLPEIYKSILLLILLIKDPSRHLHPI